MSEARRGCSLSPSKSCLPYLSTGSSPPRERRGSTMSRQRKCPPRQGTPASVARVARRPRGGGNGGGAGTGREQQNRIIYRRDFLSVPRGQELARVAIQLSGELGLAYVEIDDQFQTGGDPDRRQSHGPRGPQHVPLPTIRRHGGLGRSPLWSSRGALRGSFASPLRLIGGFSAGQWPRVKESVDNRALRHTGSGAPSCDVRHHRSTRRGSAILRRTSERVVQGLRPDLRTAVIVPSTSSRSPRSSSRPKPSCRPRRTKGNRFTWSETEACERYPLAVRPAVGTSPIFSQWRMVSIFMPLLFRKRPD